MRGILHPSASRRRLNCWGSCPIPGQALPGVSVVTGDGAAMTFRDDRGSREVGQLETFSPGPKTRARTMDMPALDVNDSTVEVIEIEDGPAIVEEPQVSPAPSEDPVRLYLKEIGKVPLLRADEEVAIGRRIEVGQIALRRALGGIPMAVSRLLALVDQVRREEIPLDDVILLPEGGDPRPD